MTKHPTHLPSPVLPALALAAVVVIASACGGGDSVTRSEMQAEVAAMQVNMQNEVAVLRSEMESQMDEIEDGISAGIEMMGAMADLGSGLGSEMQGQMADMQAEVMSEMAGMLSEAPGVVEQVKGQVAAAVELYDDLGEAAFAEITSSGDYIDGELYVFVLSADGIVAYAADPDRVGQSFSDLDSIGASIVQGILDDATPDGAWTTYRTTNPTTGRDEPKRSWVVARNGLVFGSGYYNDVDELVKDQVAGAIEHYEAVGSAAFEEITSSGDYIDGEMYVFVGAPDGVILAHAANPDLVGQDLYDLQDSTGAYIVRGILDTATPDGAWTTYRFTNPTTGEEEPKHTWAVLNDGLVFGSGRYVNEAELAQAMVADAIERYREAGPAVFEEITAGGRYASGEIYVFVVGPDGSSLAHAANSDLVGQDLSDLQDSAGLFVTRGILDAATPDGAWTIYQFTNPATGREQPKHSWVVRHNGLVFGAGYYTDS